MRDATRIKQLVEDALEANNGALSSKIDREIVSKNLNEIWKIADSMDARTGTKDPNWWQRVQARFK